ncbi:MAG TPA: FeoA family protein [Gammaproteobacteria bacterium]|jgi:ferrous iron transport protein A|nr:FeoA family protein [Gammaproteobacteria bacterium]
MQLNQLKPGDKVRIQALLGGAKAYRQRLLAMGLLPGVVFTVTRFAPLGDPIEILLRGFALCLRKHEASLLQVEVV